MAFSACLRAAFRLAWGKAEPHPRLLLLLLPLLLLPLPLLLPLLPLPLLLLLDYWMMVGGLRAVGGRVAPSRYVMKRSATLVGLLLLLPRYGHNIYFHNKYVITHLCTGKLKVPIITHLCTGKLKVPTQSGTLVLVLPRHAMVDAGYLAPHTAFQLSGTTMVLNRRGPLRVVCRPRA